MLGGAYVLLRRPGQLSGAIAGVARCLTGLLPRRRVDGQP